MVQHIKGQGNWHGVLFSDDFFNMILKRERRTRDYWHMFEPFPLSCIQDLDSLSGGGVMMWMAISNLYI